MQKAPSYIRDAADVARGVAELRARCPLIDEAVEIGGMPPLRLNPAGLPGLLRIVIGQQVSVASAAAIWARFEKIAGPVEAERLLRRRETTFRKAGLSGPKIRTVRAVATAVASGALPIDRAHQIPPEQFRDLLLTVHGIGPWTADIFQMFCLGLADGWAPGDLALQIEAAVLLGQEASEARLSIDELEALAERWRPWRSVAARVLWCSYQARRGTTTGTPV
ncbi:MAG: DNA-3-methyladenine glycosylase 2 family protein [Pseudomonadota bacterium]